MIFKISSMRALLLSFLFIVSHPGKTQNTFFKWFETPKHEIAYDAVQTDKGDYLIVGEKGTSTDPLYSFILKISMNGFIVDEKEIPYNSGRSRIITIDKLPGAYDRFLLTGARDSVTDTETFSSLFLMIIDDSMEILSLKEFSAHRNRLLTPWKTAILSDSLFYLLYRFDTIHKGHLDFDLAITKFKIPFDSLCSFHRISSNPWSFPQDIYFNPKGKNLQVVYCGSAIAERKSEMNIMELSDDLEFISSRYGPENLYINISVSPLNDSIIYTTGSNEVHVPPMTRDIGCYLLNDTAGIVRSMEFYNDPDTLIYSGRGGYSLLTNSSTSRTFIISHYNYDVDHYPWPTKPDWIQLTRTDFDLNIIDHRFYGGDACYVAHTVKTTADGGIFITGFRYDYQIQGNPQYDVFILKTDSAGRLTGIPESDNISVSEAILTPTPGSDYVFAVVGEQHPYTQLQLWDLQGRMVLEKMVYGHMTKVSTIGLSSGIYTYSFTAGGKMIGRGKWIKK